MLTDDDSYAGGVASGDHVRELVSVAAFGGEDVGDGLVVRPPLAAGDVLLWWAH